ncbi:molybdopterin-dependent oxidoreductase [Aeromonas cavernicola]|uniref:Oxidoreductase molybdopterin-binding domain-containing protein n=1 Tax=Aeromonas cavernicola TaxID=1006623 RepID=A0A2H9U144_9GAMM|nr:molybdopterin-dependent oxidoreductase [Aeromonas cavernicola]PJG57678.1 hypothetical protein CUC53_16730 [Aeromonas cavernicola]
MTVIKRWIAYFLLILISASLQAAPALMTLALPDGQWRTVDEASLAKLPHIEFTTTTPWTLGTRQFRGPTLATLLAAYGVPDAKKAIVSGLNGYQQLVDLTQFDNLPLTLVRYENGQPLTRRNKGPLWLLLPFTDHPTLDIPAIHNSMVWQVTRIEIVN